MNMFYFYLVLLLLIFMLLYKAVCLSINFATAKIKLLSILALSLLLMRYIAVFIFFISNSIKYLYLFKPLVFLNSLAIPILAMISIYILARKDKLKIKYFIAISAVILLIYIFVISKYQANIEIYKNLGYRMYFINNNLLEGMYLIINTILFFSAITLLSNRIMNRFGMWLVLISSFVVMLEIVLKNMGISIFPVIFLGDIFWLMTSVYSLNKLKK